MKITVFSKPSCVQCSAMYRKLTKAELPYSVTDVTEDDAALAYITGDLGYSATPVVVVEHEDGTVEHWYGNRPDRVDALVAALAAVA